MSASALRPVQAASVSLVDRVAHEIRAAIVAGRLRPGQRLIISDLTEQLNASAIPVREALARLAGQGLVVLRPSRPAVVASIDPDDLREIYRQRVLLEVDAIGRAGPLMGDGDLAGLRDLLGQLVASPYGSERFWTLHRQFHRALLRPVLTPRLDRTISGLWEAAERYIRIVYMETDLLAARSVRDRHLPLVQAAERRSAPDLERVLRDHLRSNEDELVSTVAAMVRPDERTADAGA